MQSEVDWRWPENRREAFLRFYGYHLKYRAHPGMVYSWLPALAEEYGMTDQERAWLVWINGNTQNPVTSKLILDVAPSPEDWRLAVEFVDTNFSRLQWDTDRRYHKARFGEATEKMINEWGAQYLNEWWGQKSSYGWEYLWKFATGMPYMGRLSAWSMIEYARILLPKEKIIDAPTLLLKDRDGSKSHRNGLCLLMGMNATRWGWEEAEPYVTMAEILGEDLLREARARFPDQPDVSRLTLESALCTYKSWHKPNRRYPGVYADMALNRLRWAEERWGTRFECLWRSRRETLPVQLRAEDNPADPGLSLLKQNLYLETGVPYGMGWEYPDMMTPEELDIRIGELI